MNQSTITRLNQINRDFYRITAVDFDQTRGTPWPGWEQILPHLPAGSGLSVLDVGCGNGRFGLFLAAHMGSYHGIDSSVALLERARAALETVPALTVRLEERDIVERPPDAGEYDLVALFGVIHHVPGAAERLAFMRALGRRVRPGGVLAFACWRFYEYDRFRERLAPWPEDLESEPGDYLLDWRRGQTALRYCHYVDDAEHARLVAAAGLREIATYRADGFTGDVNRYSILRREMKQP